jgi:hypothetical protein
MKKGIGSLIAFVVILALTVTLILTVAEGLWVLGTVLTVLILAIIITARIVLRYIASPDTFNDWP